ncbi:MAG: hypothetical protein OXI67_15750 [Candidatus Poribacteria bacterium]|nr:hypothetical protein [Candidatus Poribacteria bacterium]
MKRTLLVFTLLLTLFLWISTTPAPVQNPPNSNTPSISLSAPQDWIPTRNNICIITVALTNAPANSNLTFQLESTNWPGYCMNAFDAAKAVNGSPDKEDDLKFLESSQEGNQNGVTLAWDVPGTESDGTAITEGNTIFVSWGNVAPTSFVLKVNCYDYGAVGKVVAGLYKGGGLNGPQYAKTSVMVPYAQGNSKYIAHAQKSQTGWQNWDGTESEDTETGPVQIRITGMVSRHLRNTEGLRPLMVDMSAPVRQKRMSLFIQKTTVARIV